MEKADLGSFITMPVTATATTLRLRLHSVAAHAGGVMCDGEDE